MQRDFFMEMSPRLELRQGQQLGLTRQLLQAIKLLQMSQGELSAFIQTELEKNPLLEREDGSREDVAVSANDNGQIAEDDWLPSSDANEIAATFDTDVENIFPEDGALATQPVTEWAETDSPYWQQQGTNRDNMYEGISSEGVSLHDALLQQLDLAEDDLQHRFIGQQLVELVDDAGYITAPLEDIAAKLNISFAEVLSVLNLLQSFDPPGICARNLQECLTLQLKEKDRFDPAMEQLVLHLDLVAKGDMVGLRRICGVDAEDLADMMMELRKLDPKPGAAFVSSYAETLIPDVNVRRDRKGIWQVELNADALPRLLVNETYASRISHGVKTKDEKHYISACLQTASWLVRSLDQRAKTVLKVATEIVRQQESFFEKGVSELKPMLMRDIADAIEMHESTVSRVTSNKYMATPRGTFEFRYFFTTGLVSEDGESVSSTSVRHQIKALIEEEQSNNVLSDDAIVDLLKKQGVIIARRTVAKYRDMMHIPTSAIRKRQKRSRA